MEAFEPGGGLSEIHFNGVSVLKSVSCDSGRGARFSLLGRKVGGVCLPEMLRWCVKGLKG